MTVAKPWRGTRKSGTRRNDPENESGGVVPWWRLANLLARHQGITPEESEARHPSARNSTGAEEETSPYKSPYIEKMRL
jgi:hypothetical protein